MLGLIREVKWRRASLKANSAAITLSYVAFSVGGLAGAWLFVQELVYATTHPGAQLSGILELAGLAIVAVSIGGIAATVALSRLTSHQIGSTAE